MDEKSLIIKCRSEMEVVIELLDSNSEKSLEIFKMFALNPSGKIRREAGEWLGKKGRDSFEKTFNFLKSLMKDDEVNIRWTVAIAFGELGVKNYSIVLDDIRIMSDDTDWTVRESAAGALVAIHEKNPDSVYILEDWARDSRENVRRAIAESLGRGVGKKKPELALPILKMLIGDQSLYVRKAVANSFRNMSRNYSDLVMENLFHLKDDEREYARWTVTDGVRNIANKLPEKALPLLYELAKDSRRYVQGCVASVLREASKTNEEIILNHMNNWVKDENESVRKVANMIIS
ncbi:MAG TPA: HEAT repeat domain-containing protein [Pseudobacteroides sp.]|nr:HEAT repeat domain-containing protein [Pseudobacteroides sp.]